MTNIGIANAYDLKEIPVINPTTAPTPVNAIVLSGGSAYGLAAYRQEKFLSGSFGAGTDATVGKLGGIFNRANTTIGMIITNGDFDKTQLTKIASMTQNAYARSIKPVGTLADGDTIYAASVGEVSADLNMVGTLAAEVMSEAIRRAVDNKQRGNDIE